LAVCILGIVIGLGAARLLNYLDTPQTTPTALSMLKECHSALQSGESKKAKRLILLAERSTIESPLVHKHFGNLFSQMQMKEKALAHYKHYLKLQPNSKDHNNIKRLVSQLELQLKEVYP
jgi:hypothetical protein